MKYTTPAELGHHLVFLGLVDANYTDEFGTTTSSAFADAWDSIQYFIENTPNFDAKIELRQCIYNLHQAYNHLMQNNPTATTNLMTQTEEILKKCADLIKVPTL